MVAKGALAQGTFTGDREKAERFANGSPPDTPYVPPGVAAATAPKGGSTVTVLGAVEPRPATRGSLSPGASSTRSGALVSASSSPTGKTLLGQ
jgi:hypothetical protein